LDTNPKLRISNAYSFDDISIVPGTVTIDPDKVTTNFCIGSYKFSIPIICVGNIYLGGTGKTPLAIELFKILKKLNKRPAFVKKYYKN